MSTPRRRISDYLQPGKWYVWGSLDEVKRSRNASAGVGKCYKASKTRAYFEGVEAYHGCDRWSQALAYRDGWGLTGDVFEVGTIADAIEAREVSAEEGAAALAAWREEYADVLAAEAAEREAKRVAREQEAARRKEAREVVALFEAAVVAMPIEEIRAMRRRLAMSAVDSVGTSRSEVEL